MASYRIPTNILGFDEMIEGGIPVGSTVLLAGNPGSGKTLFASHLIQSNATNGRCVYCNFFEKTEQFFKNSRNFGFDFENLTNSGKLSVMEFFPLLEGGISNTISEIENEVRKLKPSLLIIDSITTLSGDLKSKQEIRILLKMLNSFTSSFNTTVVLITELPLSSNDLGFGVEEFITDSIIIMKLVEQKGQIHRCMVVMKMRETNHDMKVKTYSISRSGISITGNFCDSMLSSESKQKSSRDVTQNQIFNLTNHEKTVNKN